MKRLIKTRFTPEEVKEMKFTRNIVVNYNWYDHLVLRSNDEARLVQEAIRHHDFDTFKKFVDKYGEEYFPKYANIYDTDKDEFVGDFSIMSRPGFNLINGSEFECG